jgi:hypothetical protein
MDLILTLMKICLLMNNQIKLVIVSATMAEDEPLLRRFYRDINDNWNYPFNRSLQDHMVDRLNVDRRFHISAPDKTTQYVVDEFFEPEESSNPDTAADNIARSYQIVLDILKKTRDDTRSDVLLFSLGQAEIKTAFDYLVEHTTEFPHCAILPFLGTMDKKWKTLVEEIAKRKVELDIPKEAIYDVFTTGREDGITRIPKGTYKQVVIIATNVAEASITIDTLKYVVDIGFFKTEEFNMFDFITDLKVAMITESSRLQRKGRVGRTACGIVYYTYKRTSRTQVRPQYKITQGDIINSIMEMLPDSEERIYEIFTVLYKFINTPMVLPNGTLLPLNTMIGMINSLLEPYKNSSFYNLFKALWLYDEKMGLTDPDHRLFISYYSKFATPINRVTDPTGPVLKILNNILQGGFATEIIHDKAGIFYYIHPIENWLIRDIISGKIMGLLSSTEDSTSLCLTPKSTEQLELEFQNAPKIQSFLRLLIQFLLCVPKRDRITGKVEHFKTKMTKYLQALTKQISHLNMNPILVNLYLILRFRNDPFFMSNVLPMVLIMDDRDLSNPYSWLSNYKNVSFILKHLHDSSELVAYHSMIKTILDEFSYFDVFRMSETLDSSQLILRFTDDFSQYQRLHESLSSSPIDPRLRFVDLPEDINKKQFLYFQANGKHFESKLNERVLEYTTKFYMRNQLELDFARYNDHIMRFCIHNGLLVDKVKLILKKHVELTDFFRKASMVDSALDRLRLRTFYEPNPDLRIIRYFLTGHYISIANRDYDHPETLRFTSLNYSPRRKIYGCSVFYGYKQEQSLLKGKGSDRFGIVFCPYHLKQVDKKNPSVTNMRLITWITPQMLIQTAPYYYRPEVASTFMEGTSIKNLQYNFFADLINLFSPANFEDHLSYFSENPDFRDILDYFRTVMEEDIRFVSERRTEGVQIGGGQKSNGTETMTIDEFMKGNYSKHDKFKLLLNYNDGGTVVVKQNKLFQYINEKANVIMYFD